MSTAEPYDTLASLYDALLGHSFLERLRQVFERLTQRYGLRYRSAADVACGTGAFVHFLRLRGIPLVYGVDRSAAMLGVALARNRGNGARFLQQDFARLCLPQPVDLVTCNFDSLNYLLSPASLVHAFQLFRSNLKPGGTLIFDMVTPNQPWRGSKPLVEQAICKQARFRRSMHMDPRTGLQTSLVQVSTNGHTGLEVHRQRAYPARTVVTYLRRAGLLPLGVFDFDSLELPTARTRRIIYVARAGPIRNAGSAIDR